MSPDSTRSGQGQLYDIIATAVCIFTRTRYKQTTPLITKTIKNNMFLNRQ